MTNISTLNDVQKIIVLDYGSQYNQLIARRIREFGVFSELKSHKITADEVRAIDPIGIVLSGGPNSVYAEDAFGIDEEIFELGIHHPQCRQVDNVRGAAHRALHGV